MLGVTLIFLSLVNATNYFVVYDINKAFIVRSDSAVFWVRVGKAMKIVSERPSNTPRARLFDPDDQNWVSKNHNFWVALLSSEGITVPDGQKITVNSFENLLNTKAKHKTKYRGLDKTTKKIITLLALNFPKKKNEIPYSDGTIVIVNYKKLTDKDPYYIAAKSFFVIPDSKVNPQTVKRSLRKAFSDPDFAALMAGGGGGAAVPPAEGAGGVETPGGMGAGIDTSLIKPLRLTITSEMVYLVLQSNQKVTLDSIEIIGYEGSYSVIDPLPKEINGVDSIGLSFATTDDIKNMIGSEVVGVYLYFNGGKSMQSFVQVSPASGLGYTQPTGEVAAPTGGGMEATPTETGGGGEGGGGGGEESPEVITIDEGTPSGGGGGGISTPLLIIFIIALLAILIFLYLTYSRVSNINRKIRDFDVIIDDLKGTIQELSNKPAESAVSPQLDTQFSRLSENINRLLTLVQALSVQIDSSTNDVKESTENAIARLNGELRSQLREVKEFISTHAVAASVQAPPTARSEPMPEPMKEEAYPPYETELAGNPPEASEMFEELGPSGIKPAETESTLSPNKEPIIEISPTEPTQPQEVEQPRIEQPEVEQIPPQPEEITRPPERKPENIRAMLAEIAQKLKKLQDNPMLKAAILARSMIESETEPSKKLALQHTYQKFLDIAEGWDRIKNQVRVLKDVASGQVPETAELRMEFEALEASIEDLTDALKSIEEELNYKDYLPLIDAMSAHPNMKQRLDEFLNLLGIEEIEVPMNRPLTDEEAENVEVWDVEGFGTRQVVIDVIAKGFRSKKTGEIIRKPRVKIRLE